MIQKKLTWHTSWRKKNCTIYLLHSICSTKLGQIHNNSTSTLHRHLLVESDNYSHINTSDSFGRPPPRRLTFFCFCFFYLLVWGVWASLRASRLFFTIHRTPCKSSEQVRHYKNNRIHRKDRTWDGSRSKPHNPQAYVGLLLLSFLLGHILSSQSWSREICLHSRTSGQSSSRSQGEYPDETAHGMEIDIEKEGIEKSKVSFHVLKDFFLYFQSC
jgi:hypothetical protein